MTEGGGERRSCGSVVSARSALPHEVKVETVATWGGAINSRSVPYSTIPKIPELSHNAQKLGL